MFATFPEKIDIFLRKLTAVKRSVTSVTNVTHFRVRVCLFAGNKREGYIGTQTSQALNASDLRRKTLC